MLYLLSSVFPYSGFLVMFLIDDGSVDEDNAGLYAGILTSSFMVGRAVTAIFWGTVADTYGRKLVLVITLIASAVGSIVFGLSTSFTAALLVRFVMGMLNGTMVVGRTMISEIAGGDKEQESKGTAQLFTTMGISMLISPAIGGLLSEPVQQYPNFVLLQHFESLFAQYPFLLPNLIATVLSILSLWFVVVGIEETLPEEQRRSWTCIGRDLLQWTIHRVPFRPNFILSERRHMEEELSETFSLDVASRVSSTGHHPGENTPLINKNKPTDTSTNTEGNSSTDRFCLTDIPKLPTLVSSYWFYTFCSVAQSEVFPLFAMSNHGGLGLTESSIGVIVAVSGLVYCLGQYHTFTTCTSRFGLVRSMQVGTLLSCLPLAAMPMGSFLTGPVQSLYLGTIMGICLIWGNVFLGTMTIAANQSVEAHQRARMNGVIGLGASVARASGPIFAGCLVTFTMTSDSLPPAAGGWVVYGVLLVLGLGAYYVTLLIGPNDFGDSSSGNDDTRRSFLLDNDGLITDYETQSMELVA
jgi:MFS family permease